MSAVAFAPSAASSAIPSVAVCPAGDAQTLMQTLRVAGYRFGSQSIADLLRGGRALVEDAFGQTVELLLAPRSGR